MTSNKKDNVKYGRAWYSASRRCAVVTNLEELLQRKVQYKCIYADPPWRYSNRASRGAASNHYPTLTLEEICELPIEKLACENAHLHLWTTNAFLFDAKRVIEAWGFNYKSCLVWVKPQMGLGNYWRVSHEFLLLGVRGKLRFADRGVKSWLEMSRLRHSEKPAEFRNLLERVCDGPYLELFGRQQVPGWTVFGNQVEQRLF